MEADSWAPAGSAFVLMGAFQPIGSWHTATSPADQHKHCTVHEQPGIAPNCVKERCKSVLLDCWMISNACAWLYRRRPANWMLAESHFPANQRKHPAVQEQGSAPWSSCYSAGWAIQGCTCLERRLSTNRVLAQSNPAGIADKDKHGT